MSSDSSSLFPLLPICKSALAYVGLAQKKYFAEPRNSFPSSFGNVEEKKNENDFYDRSVSSAVIIFLLPRPCNYRRLTLGYTKRGKNDKKEEKEVKKILCSDFFTIVPNRD